MLLPVSTVSTYRVEGQRDADSEVGEKLKLEGREELLKEKKAVEYEDSEGHVYTADIYAQLLKQGVIQAPQ